MENNMLRVENLNFSYNRKSFIEDMSFTLNSGINVLLGHNGSGKTSLIKILGTIYHPNSGIISLNGVNYKKSMEIKKMIGYVPQKFNSYENVSVLEYIDFMCSFKSSSVDEYINIFEINNFKNKKLKNLSEGMKKKVLIAGALALKPKLLIADEPSSGLDNTGRKELREIYKEIKKRFPDTIILFSTHIQEDVFEEVDKIIEIDSGSIVFDGNLNTYMETRI